jgi:hypothetical protein
MLKNQEKEPVDITITDPATTEKLTAFGVI